MAFGCRMPNATREYINQHGKPSAFYSDRHAVFHVNKRDAETKRLTQFGRVLNDLNIELICADKLANVDQGQIVDNKRLGAVLKFAQEKQQEFEQQHKRRAQQRAVQQLREINPVLIHPEDFKPSTKKG